MASKHSHNLICILVSVFFTRKFVFQCGVQLSISRKPEPEWKIIYPTDVILFEGILVFYFKEMRDMFNLKLFVDTDADTRLSRRGEFIECCTTCIIIFTKSCNRINNESEL